MGQRLSPGALVTRPRRGMLSIRHKLLALVLLPLLGVLPVLGLVLLLWGNTAVERLLITKVRADLAVADGYFERLRGAVGSSTAAVAGSLALNQALQASPTRVAELLRQRRQEAALDFLVLRAPDGMLLASDSGLPDVDDQAALPPLPVVSPGGDPAVAAAGPAPLQVLSPARMGLLGPALRARVAVPLLPTRNAAPTASVSEERALVLLSTQPVRDALGRLVGHVQGGVLLNRNLSFIDTLNGIVYPEGSLPFGSRGTATLFLDDVRISTNVRLFEGSAAQSLNRAIGTRVSLSVREAVLGRGVTWLDRAFVVNQWYVSGYQPLSDGDGQRVGMLYVGYLERPFTVLKYSVLAGIGALFFGVMIVAAVASLRWARTIFKPLEQMEATMNRVQAGDLTARVGPVVWPSQAPGRSAPSGPNAATADSAGDEIARLAAHLDRLLDAIEQQTGALQRWNQELDAKVAARTGALAEAQAHLVRSEKLATVGQLTASIAHEINNPVAVIQGNLDLLRDLLGAEAVARVQPELQLVDQQIDRVRLIVTQLLQFAKPGEFADRIDAVDPAAALEDGLMLVSHLLPRHRIRIERDYRATHTVAINRPELQQVLVNLLVNAVQAIQSVPGDGVLRLGTADVRLASESPGGTSGVSITVADSGPGLSEAVLARLFDPFVTTKKEGTGLGLWISRGIVQRHGGTVSAQTPASDDAGVAGVAGVAGTTGAVFVLWLPAATATASASGAGPAAA